MSNAEKAAAYSRAGLPVFPCWPMLPDGSDCSCGADHKSREDGACISPGKHPVPRRGVKDGIEHSNPERVAAWWGTRPAANIGLPTGKPSGTYVIDLDGEAGEMEWWQLELAHGAAPTLVSRTGGGGQHRFYTLPAGVDTGNTAKRLGAHIDTRGTGGYVLLPPSNHHSGRCYEWGPRRAMAELPAWVVAMLTSKQRAAGERRPSPALRAEAANDLALRILRDEAAEVARTPNGHRNDVLFRRAAAMAELACGGEMPLEVVVDEMVAAGLACGLGEIEVTRTIQGAIRLGREKPRRIKTRYEAAAGR